MHAVAATSAEIETAHGPARVHVRRADDPRALLMLGHGAGGGVGARDLVAAADVALGRRVSVALVEQPYRVAGRRSPAPVRQLDAAWIAVARELCAASAAKPAERRPRETGLGEVPLIAGGRSAGARVACRTARETGAAAVLCLAFPLHAPGRGDAPEKSRAAELDAVEVPTLVVQGTSDPFGMPAPGPKRRVIAVAGNHSLSADLDSVAAAVGDWLDELIAAR